MKKFMSVAMLVALTLAFAGCETAVETPVVEVEVEAEAVEVEAEMPVVEAEVETETE